MSGALAPPSEIPPRRPAGAAATNFRRLARFALAGLAALLLASCLSVDPLMREICIAVVPALEDGDAAITVVAVEPMAERPQTLHLVYDVDGSDGPARREIACAFGEERPGAGDRTLLGVRFAGEDLPTGRLFALRRFWLADPEARAEGMRRVTIAPSARLDGFVTLPPGPALHVQQALDALAPAALFALLGLACSLIYGLVGRIVFVFGDLAMLGAYAAVMAGVAAVAFGIDTAAALVPACVLAAAAVVAAWGGAVGRTVLAPLAFRSIQPILVATVGLSVALQEFVARAQGVRDLYLPPPGGAPITLADGPFPVMVTPMRLVLVAVAGAVVAAVVVIFPRTRFGCAWRAVADDAGMAALLGIDPTRVLIATAVLSAGLAGIAGAVHTLAFGGTSFHMGTVLGLEAVVAAIVGGIGSLPGAVLGGVLLAAVRAAWTAAFGADWRDAVVFVLLVVALVFRPEGLLGRPR